MLNYKNLMLIIKDNMKLQMLANQKWKVNFNIKKKNYKLVKNI